MAARSATTTATAGTTTTTITTTAGRMSADGAGRGGEGDLLHLHQWLSPAFPVGGFAFSQGLESAIAQGIVRDGAGVAAWAEAAVCHGAGRADAVLLARARDAGADLAHLADLARAFAVSAERLVEAEEVGAAFVARVHRITGRGAPCPLPYPVAVGWATAPLALATETVLAFWLHGLAAQIVGAAVRFLPLGAAEGQAILADLGGAILRQAAWAAGAQPADIATSTPGADIAQMNHETLEVRIFRS
ncbi:MAG: urease accessory protein UreF [Gemmobacter sp.]